MCASISPGGNVEAGRPWHSAEPVGAREEPYLPSTIGGERDRARYLEDTLPSTLCHMAETRE
jgi:hypothetical protein